jgi:homoserine O-acetyltransferase
MGLVLSRLELKVSGPNKIIKLEVGMRALLCNRRMFIGFIVGCLVLLAASAWAHKQGQAEHQAFFLGDLKLESGQVIKDFSISYVTHGTLNADKSNAILMASSLVGNHHRIDFMIGNGKALDTSKYFIICTDAIGNGLTTSPSMVDSQHRLLVEHFGIKHVVAVAGASMGGMQSLQWGVSYPDFMDAIVALSPAARVSAWGVAFWTSAKRIFELDPEFRDGNYTKQPEKAWRVWTDFALALGANNPEGLKYLHPNSVDAKNFMKKWEDSWLKNGFDANDCIYQQNAILAHNVGDTPGMDGDFYKALKSIKSRVLVVPAKGDILVPSFIKDDAKYIKNSEIAEIPTLFGHFGASSAYSKADSLFINSITTSFLSDVVTK